MLWPDHCVQGTGGAAFHPDLNLTAADLIIRKGYNPAIDSYSALFENDRSDSRFATLRKERQFLKLTVPPWGRRANFL